LALLPLIESIINTCIDVIEIGGNKNCIPYDENMSPYEYEAWCHERLVDAGWTSRTVGGSGDQGTDIIAEKNGIRLVVQCKKWSGKVNNSAVQEVHAACGFQSAHVAAVVSNSEYTKSARQLAEKLDVVLAHHDDLHAFEISHLESGEYKLVIGKRMEPSFDVERDNYESLYANPLVAQSLSSLEDYLRQNTDFAISGDWLGNRRFHKAVWEIFMRQMMYRENSVNEYTLRVSLGMGNSSNAKNFTPAYIDQLVKLGFLETQESVEPHRTFKIIKTWDAWLELLRKNAVNWNEGDEIYEIPVILRR